MTCGSSGFWLEIRGSTGRRVHPKEMDNRERGCLGNIADIEEILESLWLLLLSCVHCILQYKAVCQFRTLTEYMIVI